MPYYGSNSDLKRAGRNVIAVDIIFPTLVIVISLAFILILLLVLEKPFPDICNLQAEDHLMVLRCTIFTYALLDLILTYILCIGITNLSPVTCLVWIFGQFGFLIVLISVIFFVPYLETNLEYIFWELVAFFILLCVYKIYRTNVVHFLSLEIKQESIVWRGHAIFE